MDDSKLGGPANSFVNEVADWLLATKDPRLTFSGKNPRIDHLFQASADFCGFMAEVTEAGWAANQWREYLRQKTGGERA